MNPDNMENEFGDLFFSLINAARLYDINPENALEHTNQKFIRLSPKWMPFGTKPNKKDCNQIELTTALICSFAITHITNH